MDRPRRSSIRSGQNKLPKDGGGAIVTGELRHCVSWPRGQPWSSESQPDIAEPAPKNFVPLGDPQGSDQCRGKVGADHEGSRPDGDRRHGSAVMRWVGPDDQQSVQGRLQQEQDREGAVETELASRRRHSDQGGYAKAGQDDADVRQVAVCSQVETKTGGCCDNPDQAPAKHAEAATVWRQAHPMRISQTQERMRSSRFHQSS